MAGWLVVWLDGGSVVELSGSGGMGCRWGVCAVCMVEMWLGWKGRVGGGEGEYGKGGAETVEFLSMKDKPKTGWKEIC